MRPLHELVAATAGSGIRITVLRSSAVSENSAATNTAVAAVSTTNARSASAVNMPLIASAPKMRRAVCPAD